MKLDQFMFSLLLLIMFSCNKGEDKCYDRKLDKSHSGICTADCPGVIGCDGNLYCNECVANSQGIKIVD